MTTAKQVMDLFEGLLPWERQDVVDDITHSSGYFGVSFDEAIEDHSEDSIENSIDDAYDAVWAFGAEDLMDEMSIYDFVEYFSKYTTQWNELLEAMEDSNKTE